MIDSGVDINRQNATAFCSITSTWVSDEDTATVIGSEPELTYNLSLHSGWNLITIPVENTYTAMTLSENITECVMISRFDAVNQTYKTYIVGGPPSFDFPILDGYGLFHPGE